MRHRIARYVLAIAVGPALGALPASAQQTADEGPGTSGFHFLNMGSSARIEALGGAGTTLSTGSDGLAWNPARMLEPRAIHVGASYFTWLQDVQSGYVGGVLPLWKGALGFGVRSLSVSEFNNVVGGSAIGQTDVAVSAGYARPLFWGISLGVAAKAFQSSVADQDATGIAADAGVRFRFVEGWDLSAAVRNLGPAVAYADGAEEQLPTQVSAGLGGRIGELRLGAEGTWENGPGLETALGAEYTLLDRLALRVGSRFGVESEDAMNAWAAGLGIRAGSGLDLDYSFRDGAIEPSHRLGVRWALGRSQGQDTGSVLSPREFYVSVLDEVLDRSLVDFPQGLDDSVTVRATAAHRASQVISEVIAERLRARGLNVEVREPPQEIPDDVTEDVAAQLAALDRVDNTLLEYVIRGSDYEILSQKRARLIGPATLERQVRIDLTFILREPESETPLWASSGSGQRTEAVKASLVPESSGYPRGAGTGELGAKKPNPLVEPAIVGGIVAGLAILFFSNRDVGE